MAIDRRVFVLGGAAAAFVRPSAAAVPRPAAFLTCARRPDGGDAAVGLDRAGGLVFTVPLPGRGHGVAVRPGDGLAVVFARRPGRFMVVLDTATGRVRVTVAATAGRHFYGHGVFSADGRRLYATENDYTHERGVVGIYDAAHGFTRVGEMDSGGIGPHEIVASLDGRHLVVANGGIATHPDYPRQKLNLASMRPTVAVLDPATGAVAASARLPDDWHRVSLRHLAVAGDGAAWIGGQYEGPSTDRVPLLYRYRLGEELEAVGAEAGFDHYIGAVAVNRRTARVAVTSPRGNRVAVHATHTGRAESQTELADVCGVAPQDGGFLITTGRGLIVADGGTVRHDLAWDNHVTAV